ncbi:MAG: hypothetical protein HY692_08775 [Cyanobacteria bacterium NC_groundwater_1444_Ag_S-0.65um_54_12]|nr:hypothetical protein [Cyanobacteria bacterium NC_groundwater_1444_Ag_S-0.65um_54_12]
MFNERMVGRTRTQGGRILPLVGLSVMLAACNVASPGKLVNASKVPIVVMGDPILVTGDPTPLPGDSAIVSNYSAGLSGTLKVPDATLISNNSMGLIETGGGAFFRAPFTVSGLTQAPQAAAEISLVNAAGDLVSNETVHTDAQGNFTFKTWPQGSETYFVKAKFSANKNFEFYAMAAKSEVASSTVEVDASSTLVAAKLRQLMKQQLLAAGKLSQAAYESVLSQLQSALGKENIPYMATDSRDILAAFDQLVLDVPELRQKVDSLATEISKPSDGWQVSKLLDSDNMAAAGLLAPGQRSILSAGTFEVDSNGNVYLPIALASPLARTLSGDTGRIPIIRFTPEGKAELFAVLPAGIRNPVMLTFSPQGDLYALAPNSATLQLEAFYGSGEMKPREGGLFKLNEIRLPEVPGRFVVDSNGAIYLALRDYQVVIRQLRIAPESEVFAGAPLQAGYQDSKGTTARFSYPASLTLGPDGAVYVADLGNNCLRRLGLDGTVTTAAGKPGEQLYRNGRGAYSRFGAPESIAADFAGNMFITDPHSKRVRRISPDGSVFLVAGSGQDGVLDGPGQLAKFHNPTYLTVDRLGNLYVLDHSPDEPGKPSTDVIRKISK